MKYSPIQPAIGMAADPLDGAVWRKSSKSGPQGNCVEVAMNLPCIVAMRDSKDPNGPKLLLTPAAWSGFLAAVRHDVV